ncbi:MAG: class I SAM-dependent methyltransferase, partial [Patescibacteria group bacterium]
MKKNTSWGGVADWYDEHLEEGDTYHSRVILPNLLRLLDIKKGEQILDLACGQGFFARAWSEAGGEVFASDISPELIERAKKKEGSGIEYHVAKGQDLSFLQDESLDKGSCVLALQNIGPYQEVLVELARVLKKDGSFYFVINHPAFRIPGASGWEWDAEKTVQYRRLDGYLSESRTEIVMDPGKTGREKTVSFHRPLQAYFKAFQKAGLVVSRLEEWTSDKESDSGPRAKAENAARKEFPLFLLLELKK